MRPSELDGYHIERPFSKWLGIDPANITNRRKSQYEQRNPCLSRP